MMRRAFGAAVLAAVAGVSGAVPAAGVQLEPADRDVTRVRVAYVEVLPNGGGLVYELTDGSAYRVVSRRACRFEDRPRFCRQAWRIVRSAGYAAGVAR